MTIRRLIVVLVGLHVHIIVSTSDIDDAMRPSIPFRAIESLQRDNLLRGAFTRITRHTPPETLQARSSLFARRRRRCRLVPRSDSEVRHDAPGNTLAALPAVGLLMTGLRLRQYELR